jgi:hypothetical protein
VAIACATTHPDLGRCTRTGAHGGPDRPHTYTTTSQGCYHAPTSDDKETDMNALATAPATDTAATKPAKRNAPAEGMKRCPGVLSLGRMAHEAPATTEHFSVNKSLPMGLATRCRVDDGLYGKAWTAAKKAGETFSGKLGADVPQSVRDALAPKAAKTATTRQAAVAGDKAAEQAILDARAQARTKPGAQAEADLLVATDAVLREAGRDDLTITRFHDALARQADARKAPGYTTELVGNTIYAMPEGVDVLGTPEGQAALEALNTARANERRRRNTEAKRASRAAAKAKA